MRLGFLVFAILVAAAPARAETPAQEVKAHLAKAKAHFDLQEYTDAETELKAAYRIDPKPEVLYAIAQAQRLGGDCAKAITSYKTYLRGNPPADQKKLADDNITTCEASLKKPDGGNGGKPDGGKPDGDKPDGKPDGGKPDGGKPDGGKPDGGKPDNGKPDGGTSEIPATERVRVGTPWYSNWPAHSFVLGGAAAIVGGGFLVAAGQKKIDHINEAIYYDTFESRIGDADSAKRTRLIGGVGIATGAVAIGVGALIYKLRGTHYQERPRVSRAGGKSRVARGADRMPPLVAIDPRGAIAIRWELP